MFERSNIAGMNFHYFRHSFERFLNDMVSLEIKAIELWAAMPHFSVEDVTIADARDMRGKIAERDLELICLTPEQCIYPINIASENSRIRDRSIAYFIRCIDLANELECPKLLVTPGWGYADQPADPAWERSRDALITLGRRAAGCGIELLLEPLAPSESNLVTTAAQLRQMLAEIDSSSVNAILDTNAMAVVDDTIESYNEAVGSRLRHVHLIDGTPEGHLAWGDGHLPLARYLRELSQIGYHGHLTFEFTTPAYWLDPLTPMKKSLAAFDAAVSASPT
ncbi:sugar phosphate isomerase/epimerase family protein [Agrobacterium sp. 33MFTa1.1]|uniref:sugar phosphate isomerase/epimerase family protein n=1 Tax=Agrobacterium sp. 33MFTa1.1 TaxID=1279031 RepID=UPI00068FCEB2|nr:sugar phosphate isomerase/epimerase family protein [Agrobacterium sp. 33MFTa1.1]